MVMSKPALLLVPDFPFSVEQKSHDAWLCSLITGTRYRVRGNAISGSRCFRRGFCNDSGLSRSQTFVYMVLDGD